MKIQEKAAKSSVIWKEQIGFNCSLPLLISELKMKQLGIIFRKDLEQGKLVVPHVWNSRSAELLRADPVNNKN